MLVVGGAFPEDYDGGEGCCGGDDMDGVGGTVSLVGHLSTAILASGIFSFCSSVPNSCQWYWFVSLHCRGVGTYHTVHVSKQRPLGNHGMNTSDGIHLSLGRLLQPQNHRLIYPVTFIVCCRLFA